MSFKKLVHRFALVPTGSIHIKPYGVSSESLVEVMQDFHKTCSISSFYADKTITTQKRSNPACKIKPFLMLACGRNVVGLSLLRPSPPQSRMQSEACLVLKDHRLPRTQIFEFFLTSVETSWPPPSLLEYKHNWPASDDILTDASSSEPVAPSALSQTLVLNVLPKSDHPTESGLAQKPEETVPDSFPPVARSLELTEKDVQASACPLRLLSQEYLPHESSGLNSFGLILKQKQSNPASALLGLKVSLLSLNQPKPQEHSCQMPPSAPLLPLDELCRMNS